MFPSLKPKPKLQDHDMSQFPAWSGDLCSCLEALRLLKLGFLGKTAGELATEALLQYCSKATTQTEQLMGMSLLSSIPRARAWILPIQLDMSARKFQVYGVT